MTAARDVLAQLRIEDGRLWVEAADDRQHADAAAVLEGAQPYHFISRGRGWSKTTDLAGIALAWLLASPAPRRYFAAAADADQARLLLDSIDGFARRSPSAIGARVKIEARRVTVIDTGATLEVVPADAASSWGLRPDGVILDEVAWWSDTPAPQMLLDSLLSSAAKNGACRVALITSPSSPSHFAHALRDHAESDPLWRLSETAGPPPWLDPARVEEQRRRLSAPMFARLFEGQWMEGTDSLTSLADVRACVTHSGTLDPRADRRYVAGLDIGVRRDRTAFAIGHREDERVVIDLLAVWRPSRLRPVNIGEVETYVQQAAHEYRAPLLADYHQAAQLTQRLRERGLRVRDEHFTAAGNAKRAAVMAGLLRDRRLGLPKDEELIEELASLVLIERQPGQFRIDHRPGKHDDRAQAIALVASELAREREVAPASAIPFHPWGGSGRVPLHPQHDSSGAHRAWAEWARQALGHTCPECVAEFARRRASGATAYPDPPATRLAGGFRIHPKTTRGGR